MEQKPQVASPQKSPVSNDPKEQTEDKVPPSLPLKSESDADKSSDTEKELSNITHEEPSKFELCKIRHESSSETQHKKDTVPSNEETLPHPIISIDIQKNMPYENKQVVPPSDKESKSDAVISPQVVASVVTTAVVAEAALSVGGTDGLVLTGDKFNSDSSSVDAVVEQVLNKISENGSSKTEVKTISDSKPISNGDIDHSPFLDENSENKSELLQEDSTSDALKQEKSETLSSKDITSLTETKNDNSNSCNGIPGIITVESISKKETKLSEGDIKDPDLNSQNKINVEKDTEEKITSAEDILNKTGEDQANETGSTPLVSEEAKCKDKEEERDSDDKNISKQRQTNENLTDSAKLHKIHDKKEESEKPSLITESEKAVETDTKTENSSSRLIPSADQDSNNFKKKEIGEAVETVESFDDTASKISERKEDKSSKLRDIKAEDILNSSMSSSKKDIIISSDTEATLNQKTASITPVAQEIDACEMTLMMTSQILTPEQLNTDGIEESVKKEEKTDSPVPKDESCRISASRISPVTCDVGVGLDEQRTIRVASGDGGEEEIDGQEATTEVEVTEESNVYGSGVANDGAPTPSAASPSGDQSPTPEKTSMPSSKTSSAVSHEDNESHKEDDKKSSSAVSRSSIPEPIVYEPPERRKSATSVTSEDKKDVESDKSVEDAKETEKQDEKSEKHSSKDEQTDDAEEIKEETKTIENSEVKIEENKDEEDNKSGKLSTDQTDAVKTDQGNEVEQSQETPEKEGEDEKGKESEKEKEDTDVTVEIHERPDSIVSVEKTESDSAVIEDTEDAQEDAKDAQEQKETKDEAPTPESTISNATEDVTIEAAEKEGADKADEIKRDADAEEEREDESKKDAGEQAVEIEKNEANKTECIDVVSKVMDEPKTLVEEESKLEESSEKEKKTEEKEEDEAKAEKEVKDEIPEDTASACLEEKEGDAEKDDKADQEVEEIGEIDEKKESETASAEKEEIVETDGKDEEPGEKGEKEKGDDVEGVEEAKQEEQEGQEKEDQTKDSEAADDAEEQKNGSKDEEIDETPEPPPKSPTKRMRSPDKAGRRGVSPASSPPKPLKTPPSPQKPQKSTSPKKKNGMLSPIKTPKTPGSDIRKLPPIKAPVGLAPNPNLKNIRSKIGSFDNIRYKPGGGDKKVISKKLDWKAAPKIGSLDHTFKSGEKKHGKSHSKGDTKEGKLVDGQSPLPSGDEGEPEGTTTEIAEKLGAASISPAAIAAES